MCLEHVKYPSPDQTHIPNPAADPRLMISYPGWMIGVVPDYAGAADDLAAGKRLPTVFTVDGETFHDSPDGLMVVKGVDSTARIREIVAKINGRDEYKDSVVFVFGITYNHKGEAVDALSMVPRPYFFSPGEPADMAKIDEIENRAVNPPRYVQYVNQYINPIDYPDMLRLRPVAGRNDPCPCGSGRKFKKCCMRK